MTETHNSSFQYQNRRVSETHHGGAESSERALVDGVRGESEVQKMLDTGSDVWYSALANIVAHFAGPVVPVSRAYTLLFAGPAHRCFQGTLSHHHPGRIAMQKSSG
jgi:hypothetical protein